MAQKLGSEWEEKLIDQVRDRQELWDKKHPDFKNQIKKNVIWMEIAQILSGDETPAQSKDGNKITMNVFYNECNQ